MLPYGYIDLSHVILNVHKIHSQQESLYKKKIQLRQDLYNLLKNELKDQFDLFIVGSTQTQFALKCSDLDLCLVIYNDSGDVDDNYVKSNHITIKKLIQIQKVVVNSGLCCTYELLCAAVVPIFRFTDKIHNITVDLNINRLVTIRNTFLLTSYNFLDNRVAPLIIAVKCWARNKGINSSYYGTLSSYSLTLMVIHFLQNGCNPPVLPLLQPICGNDFFQRIDTTGRMLEPLNTVQRSVSQTFIHQNYSPLGSLFYEFIQYYSLPFTFNRIISISNSSTQLHRSYLVIEDPFEQKNTAYSVFSQRQFEKIKQAFFNTLFAIQSNCFLVEEFEYDNTNN